MISKWAALSAPQNCATKKHCCDAKNCLRPPSPFARLCTAATRSLTELSAFLDVSSLNLAALRCRHFFHSVFLDPPGLSGSASGPVLDQAHDGQPPGGGATWAANDSMSIVRSRCTRLNPRDRSNRASFI